MKPCQELLDAISPAYSPCKHKDDACGSLPWDEKKGHIPRGYCGATANLSDVILVLVFAEPGDPHAAEEDSVKPTYEYTYQSMKDGNDLFHCRVREILNLCFPGETYESQMKKTWMTESVLCSAPQEGGRVAASAWKACTDTYLKPQLELLNKNNSVIAALGGKARERISSIGGIKFIPAYAAAPPGCNRKGASESWKKIAEAVQSEKKRREGAI